MMTVQMGWYGNQRIIYCKASGDITLTDVQFIMDKIQIMEQPDVLLHSFNDVREVNALPSSLREMVDLLTLSRSRHRNRTGWVVIAGSSNRLLQFLMTTLSQTFGFKLRMLPTLEEGLRFLEEMDDTLPPLLPFDETQVKFEYSNAVNAAGVSNSGDVG